MGVYANSLKKFNVITDKLQDVIEKSDDTVLIPVWIRLDDINSKIFYDRLLDEHQMDYKIFENSDNFNSFKLPEIKKECEEKYGTIKANEPVAISGVKSCRMVTDYFTTVNNPPRASLVFEIKE